MVHDTYDTHDTHKIVGHTFGTNYEQYTRTFVTLSGKGEHALTNKLIRGTPRNPSHTQQGIQRLVIQHWT